MARERIVLDTNVLISAILSTTSVPAQSLDRALRDGQFLASVATLRELTEKLLSARFDPYVPRDRREALLQRFAAVLEIVQVLQEVRECRDPDDDMFLEVAVNGRADVVVSGDRDLLALHPFRGAAILTPTQYITRS